MGGRPLTIVATCLALLLVLAPAASALEIATRGIKASPSEAYSPDTAWEQGIYGCGVTVAVFDEGVDDKHPYLDGKVVAGYDATHTQEMWTLANGGNPQPLVGTHGTPVAGIAVSHAGQPFFSAEDAPAYGEDDRAGVAPCAWLVDVQFSDVPNAFGDTPATDTFTTDVLQAFDWAIEHEDADWGDDDPSNDGIDVITMSWSPNDKTDGTDPICQAATEAVEAGIVVLGSAGNSGSTEEPDLGCPTGADGAISVANIWNKRTVDRSDDELRETSTWGPRTDDGDDDPYEELKPDVAAPGHLVVSTGSSLTDGREHQAVCLGPEDTSTPGAQVSLPYQCEQSFGGTSAATPMTAGVVALMLDANPALTPAEVAEILHQTAEPHQEMEISAANMSAQWDHRFGYGMIDAYKAVTMAQQWPGMELGKDTDADTVRDFQDQAPRDPTVTNLTETVDEILSNATGNLTVDTDGDMVPDDQDAAPLDPFRVDETLTAAADETDETPGVGAPVLLLAIGGLALLVRRRRR